MKILIRSVFLILDCVLSTGIWAQPNTKVTGSLKDLEEGTKVYISPMRSLTKQDSALATNGKFEFNLYLQDGDMYLLSVGKNYSIPGSAVVFYMQPGVIKIKGNEPLFTDAEFTGSKFAKEQNALNKYIRNAKGLSKSKEISAALSEAMKVKDAVKVGALRRESQKIDSTQTNLYRKWVSEHLSSPISAMTLALYVRERDMEVLENLLDQLKPGAKQNALAKGNAAQY